MQPPTPHAARTYAAAYRQPPAPQRAATQLMQPLGAVRDSVGAYQQPPPPQRAATQPAHPRMQPDGAAAALAGLYQQPPLPQGALSASAGVYQQPPTARRGAGQPEPQPEGAKATSASAHQQPPTPWAAVQPTQPMQPPAPEGAKTFYAQWLASNAGPGAYQQPLTPRTVAPGQPTLGFSGAVDAHRSWGSGWAPSQLPVPTSSWATTPLPTTQSSRATAVSAAPEFRMHTQPPPPQHPAPRLSDLGLWLQPLGCLEYEEVLRTSVGITSLHDMMKASDKLTVGLLEALGLPRDKALAIWQANGGHRSPMARIAATERATEMLAEAAAPSPRHSSRHGSTLSLLASYVETAGGRGNAGVGSIGSAGGSSRRWHHTPHLLPPPSSALGYSDTESESDTETEEDSTDDDDDDFETFTPRPSEGVPGSSKGSPRRNDAYPSAVAIQTHVLHRIEGRELGLKLREADLIILEATGVAAKAGLRPGQLIVMVEGAEVQTAEEVRLILQEWPIDQPVHITVRSESTGFRSPQRSIGAQLTTQSPFRDGAFRPRSMAAQDPAFVTREMPQPPLQLCPEPEAEPEPSLTRPEDTSEDDEDARSDVDWSLPDVQRGVGQPSLVLTDQLTPSQILDMRMAFSFLDVDADGILSVSELKHFAPDATEAELQDMLGEVDADGSHSIELPEFITMMVRKLKPGGDNEDDRADALRAFYDKNGNGFFSAARLNARLEDLMREPEGTSSALAGLRHDTMRQERLKMTVGKIAGPTVHHWNQNGKILHRSEDIQDWANGGEVPQHIYMAVLLQLGIASVSEPPVETQHHPKWTNIHTNIRKHMFNPQPWHLPTDTASSAPAPIQRMLPKFKVVEYCPDVFHNLRKIFNVNTLAYRASLGTLDWNNIEKNLRPAPHAHAPDFKLVGQADAAGKSGAWFFFSADQRFMIKVMTAREKDLMLKILQPYYTRITESIGEDGLPRTMLPQFFGMYAVRSKAMDERITTADGKTKKHAVAKQRMYWVVMTNILASKLKVHEKYDLKGSTHGRTASQKEVSKGVRTIFKDNDFLEKRLRDGTAFNIGMATESLLDGLKQDVEFLKAMNLIDYSLLTGVHTFRPGWRSGYDYAVGDCVYPPSFKAHRLCFRCLKQGKSQLREPTWPSFGAETATKSPGAEVDEGDILWRCEKERRSLEHLSLDDQERLTWAATKQEVLFFGIIDILTEYRKMKKAEHFFMGTVKGVKKEISCQPSEFYGARFEKFCRECILGGNQQQTVAGEAAAANGEGAATDDVGPARTQSSGSSSGAVLELAGQSAFTKRPRARQRRGAIATEDEETFEWQGRQMPVSMKGVLLSSVVEEDDTKRTRTKKDKKDKKARGSGETDTRYGSSVASEHIAAPADAEAPAPTQQSQESQQPQEQHQRAGGSATSSASSQTSDEEHEDGKTRRRRQADARYREQREQQFWR